MSDYRSFRVKELGPVWLIKPVASDIVERELALGPEHRRREQERLERLVNQGDAFLVRSHQSISR